MDNFKMLIAAHLNAKKLEKKIKKERVNLIKEYKNKSCSHSDWYIMKIRYTAFAVKLRNETAKFDKLLESMEEENKSIHSLDSLSNDDDEIVHNDNYDGLEESDDTESSSGTDKEYSKLYRNSVPITDNLSVDEAQIKMEEDDKEQKGERTEETEQTEQTEAATAESEEKSVELSTDDDAKSIKSKQRTKRGQNKNNPNKRDNKEYPALSKGKNGRFRKKTFKESEMKRGSKIGSVRAGYKYQGKGFSVFTNSRNRGKPIYGSTMLFCHETCNENDEELKTYLIECGKFKKEMIEEIVFKTNFNGDNYSLIKVRGKLNYIKKKIKTLNKNKNKDILSIFHRSTYISAMDYVHASNKLYVSNFDLLRSDSHKRFTNLFLRFGELVKDIEMGLDKSRDPFAIVHFREQQDAQRCFEHGKGVKFDGKVLNIRFSKF